MRRKTCLPPITVAELPLDVLSLIFRKLTPLEILGSAQWVCSSWWKVSKEPYLFRRIDLRKYWKSSQTEKFMKMVMLAIDRSCGGLEEFLIADYYGEDLLKYVLDKSYSIKCLRFVKCYGLSDDLLLEFVRKFPCIEELELSYCWNSMEAIAKFGRLCSNLKCFRLTGHQREHHQNQDVFAIANNMPGLRRLHLFRNYMGDEGLQAILDKCTHLEYLDLRCCCPFKVFGEETWQKCCERIPGLRAPNESVGDLHYALKRCEEYESKCCGCGYCISSFHRYDPDEDKRYNVKVYDYDDDEFENLIFLPRKSATCYL
ncbi:hypothetical protein ACHQM5_022235 [Ranunculus cassubicifolius]